MLQKTVYWIVFGVLIITHFGLLLYNYRPALSDPAANRYYAQGSLLSTTGKTYFKMGSNVQYIDRYWLVTDEGKYFSIASPGFSTIIGLFFTLFGYKGGLLTNLFLASLTLVGLFLILKKELDWKFAAAGTIVLAINPIFNSHAIQGFSHIAVMCFLTWGIFFLFSWKEQRSILDAILAGFILGCIPALHYPDAIFGIAIGSFLLWEVRQKKAAWKHILACCGAAVIPVLFILIRNHFAFGAFWKTAYFFTNEQGAFGWEYFVDHLTSVRAFRRSSLGLFSLLGIMGMLLMCFRKKTRQKGLLYVLLALAPTFLHMSYYWPEHVGNQDLRFSNPEGLRFFLPLIIVFILSGMWFLKEIIKGCRKWQAAVLVTFIILIQGVLGDFGIEPRIGRLVQNSKILATITDRLIQATNKGDIIISHKSLLTHLDYLKRWNLADATKVWKQTYHLKASYSSKDEQRDFKLKPKSLARSSRVPQNNEMIKTNQTKRLIDRKHEKILASSVKTAKIGKRSVIKALFSSKLRGPSAVHSKKQNKYLEAFKGLSPDEREKKIVKQLKAWSGGGSIYFVGVPETLDQMQGKFLNGQSFEIIERIYNTKNKNKDRRIKLRRKENPGKPETGGKELPRLVFEKNLKIAEEVVIARWQNK